MLLKHCIWFPKPPGHPIMSAFILGTKLLLNNLLRRTVLSKTPKHRVSGTSFSSCQRATCSSAEILVPICRLNDAMWPRECLLPRGWSTEGCTPVPVILQVGVDVWGTRINMRRVATSLNTSLPFFIKQKWLGCNSLPFLPHAHAHPFTVAFSGTHSCTQSSPAPTHPPKTPRACHCQDWVVCESCLLHTWQIRRFQHTLGLFFLFPFFFFCHAATSGRINGVQLFSNVIHFTGFGS